MSNQVVVKLDDTTIAMAEALAAQFGISKEQLIVNILTNYAKEKESELSEEEKKAAEDFVNNNNIKVKLPMDNA